MEQSLERVARRRARASSRDWRAAQGDLPAQPGRPRGAALLAAHRRAVSSLPAAGLPWFMTMFGRDSIFTSLQALPFAPELAATTLRGARRLAGQPRRRLPRRGSGPDPARDALRRDDRVRGAAALAVLRLRRRDAAVRRSCSTSTSAGPATAKLVRELEHEARAALNWIDEYADLHGQRLRLVQAPQREDRPREPVLEGLLGLDLVPRRRAARLPARDLRAPGLRLRRQGARRPPGPRRLEGRGARRPARARGRRPQAPLQPRLLGRGRRVLRARARRRRDARSTRSTSNIGHLLWSGIVDKTKAKAVVAAPDGPTALLRLGRPHAGRGRGPLQPDRLPRRHGLAVRQLVHRLGPAPLRLQGRGGADRRRRSSTPPSSSTAGCPEAFGGYRARADEVPGRSTRRRAARRPGRPARRCCCCARCSASSRSASTSSSTRRCRRRIGHLELLDIPGRWGRIDAFGRGRVDVEPARAGRTARSSSTSRRGVGK